MSLGKQAKILTKGQSQAVLSYLTNTRHPERDRVIFLLSLRAGLRAKEIACLTWSMISDAEGTLTDAIHLTNIASKGKGGRVIPLCKELQLAIISLKEVTRASGSPSPYVISTERAANTSSFAIVNKFSSWYRALGFSRESSHTGNAKLDCKEIEK